jgi:hypothetical protein
VKITASSDWRDGLAYDIPVLVADVMPGDPTRCFVCGPASEPRERIELWAVKHRHPNNHAGVVRFYCLEHRPQPPRRPEPVAAARAKAPTRAPRRAPAARPAAQAERPRAVCPNCFIEVPPGAVCGICGEAIAG